MNNLVSQPKMKHRIQVLAVLAAVKRTQYIDIDVLRFSIIEEIREGTLAVPSIQKESNFRY